MASDEGDMPLDNGTASFKHSRQPSDLLTEAGSGPISAGADRSWLEPKTMPEALQQMNLMQQSSMQLEAQVRMLQQQLSMIAASLRYEDGYTIAILSLLQSGGEDCVAIAEMVARSKAEARSNPRAGSETAHVMGSWTLAQAREFVEAQSQVTAPLSSKEVAAGLVQMLGSEDEVQVSGAAWALADFVQTGEGPCQDALDAGCIPLLLQVVRSGSSSAREAAALTLEMLSRDPDIHPSLVEANCIHVVTQALLAEGDAGKMSLTRLIERFSRTKDYQEPIVEAGGIAATVQLLEDGNAAEQQLAATVVARLAEHDRLHDQVLGAPEVVPGLLGMVEDDQHLSPRARAMAAEALEVLVAGEDGLSAAQEHGTVEALLSTLREGEDHGRLAGSGSGRSFGAGALAAASHVYIPPMSPDKIALHVRSLSILKSLSVDFHMREMMRTSNAVKVLMDILTTEAADQELQEVAAEVLEGLACAHHHGGGGGNGGSCNASVATEGGEVTLEQMQLEQLVSALRLSSRSRKGQLALLHVLRAQMTNRVPEEDIQIIVAAGVANVLSYIVSAYYNEMNPAGQPESPRRSLTSMTNMEGGLRLAVSACKCVWAIAGHKQFVSALHEGGVTAPMISLLRETSIPDEVRLHAALSIERLSSNRSEASVVKDLVTMGAAEGMFEVLKQGMGGFFPKVALTGLRYMALHPRNLKPMSDIEGGIELLVQIVTDGHPPEQELAARALWNLAFEPTNHERIAKGLVPLIRLLESGTEMAKQASAKALSILAVNDEYSQQLMAGGCVEPLVRMLHGSAGDMEAAAGALANIAYDEESRRAIAAAGALEPLIRVMEYAAEDPDQVTSSLVEMACQCLENLAFSEDVRPRVATRPAITALMHIIKDGREDGQLAALGCLTNLATNDTRRNLIHSMGAIPVLIQALRASMKSQMREASAKAIWNLTYSDECRAAVAEAGAVELLVGLLGYCEPARVAVARALWNLAYIDDYRIQIWQAGGVPLLVGLLRSNSAKEQEAATKALVNLTINENIREEIAVAGAIQPLGGLLSENHSFIQRSAAARALTNLAMHSRNRLDMQTTGQVLPALIRMLKPASSQTPAQQQKEIRQMHFAAAKALRNIVTDEGPRKAAREEGAIHALQAILHDESMDKDTRDVINRVLEAMAEGKRRPSNAGQLMARDRQLPSLAAVQDNNSVSSQLSECAGGPDSIARQ